MPNLRVVAAQPRGERRGRRQEVAARLRRAAVSAVAVEDAEHARLFYAVARAVELLVASGDAECWRWTPVVRAVEELAEGWPR